MTDFATRISELEEQVRALSVENSLDACSDDLRALWHLDKVNADEMEEQSV